MQSTGKHEWLNKVPEITLYFWIIKVLCTTVGETAADFLNINLNFGLTITSIVMGVLLAIALFFQFKTTKYVPAVYWLAVFLISIFGTLVTDNLTDSLGVPLELSTVAFAILLAITFAIWYAMERTLSIHAINTWKREAFYWLAILFTFALGTAAGDLMAESLGLGYFVTGAIVAVMIVSVIIAWRLKIDSVLTFWIGYILTRPLGASIGDFLSQTPANGGLGLGPTVTTFLFVLAILLTVVYLSVTKKDQMIEQVALQHEAIERSERGHLFWQITGMILMLALIAGGGYFVGHAHRNRPAVVASPNAPLGDLSTFKQITDDTLTLVRAGKLADAKTRITDLETAWDDAESQTKPISPEEWSKIDSHIDKALRQLRAVHQDPKGCETSLSSLIDVLDSLDRHEK